MILLINDALSIAPCHVASGTSGPESSDALTSARENASARFSNEIDIIEEEIAELGIKELFDPQSNEVCARSGKNYH